MKYCIWILLSILFTKTAVAQKDTAVYYLNAVERVVSSKDKADFILKIVREDTSINRDLWFINEFYITGEKYLIASSITPPFSFTYDGQYTLYYRNGHKARESQYSNGVIVGDRKYYYMNGNLQKVRHYDNDLAWDDVLYYPSGKFYCKLSYLKTEGHTLEEKMVECRDSTGKILAQNGNGHWLIFDDAFTMIATQGKVVKGLRDSIWTSTFPDNSWSFDTYKKGKLIDYKFHNAPLTDSNRRPVETAPEFPGGLDAFMDFLIKHLRYPEEARKNNIQGKVMVSFEVEKDGTLTNIKVERGIGGGCDEEALRVVKLSSPWKPGIQNGKPVRVVYSVPINFTLN